MTIAEYLQTQADDITAVEWGGAFLTALVLAVADRTLLSATAFYVTVASALGLDAAVFIWFRRRLKCPRCHAPLYKQLTAAQDHLLGSCPQCHADFSEELLHYPIIG